jgi:hypothetical protein
MSQAAMMLTSIMGMTYCQKRWAGTLIPSIPRSPRSDRDRKAFSFSRASVFALHVSRDGGQLFRFRTQCADIRSRRVGNDLFIGLPRRPVAASAGHHHGIAPTNARIEGCAIA